jgi:hypothetical protein
MKLNLVAATIHLVLITHSLVPLDIPAAPLTQHATSHTTGENRGESKLDTDAVKDATELDQSCKRSNTQLGTDKDPIAQLIRDRAQFLLGGAMMLSGIIIMIFGGKMIVNSLNNPRTSK